MAALRFNARYNGTQRSKGAERISRKRRLRPVALDPVALRDGATVQRESSDPSRIASKARYSFGYRIATSGGGPIYRRNLLKRHFKPLLKAAKLPDNLTLYCLRHSCATLLLQAGVHPKIVSERLGHASIVLTLDTYSHVLPTMQDEATTQIQRMLYG